MTFRDWYQATIVPHLYSEQAQYEQDSVAFKAIETLSRQDILQFYESMTEDELKLALYDHVRSCVFEKWDPSVPDPEDEY